MNREEDVPDCLVKTLLQTQEEKKLDWEDLCMLSAVFTLGGVSLVSFRHRATWFQRLMCFRYLASSIGSWLSSLPFPDTTRLTSRTAGDESARVCQLSSISYGLPSRGCSCPSLSTHSQMSLYLFRNTRAFQGVNPFLSDSSSFHGLRI